MSLPPISVDDVEDPRLADYRELKEHRLAASSGRFVAESERVVRRLVRSGLRVCSVLLTPPRLATLADALEGPFPVYVASQLVLDQIAGFHVHRGCLAVAERPGIVRVPESARAVVVLEGGAANTTVAINQVVAAPVPTVAFGVAPADPST